MLGVDNKAASRLQLLNTIYGASSRRVLREAGLGEGSRVLELACGTGTMTRWIAEQVGEEGRVLGVDASEDQLASARRRCAELTRVRFVRGVGGATGLELGTFDIVYVRLLLMHVTEPLRILEHAKELLRPGGALVCEEAAVDSTFCDPPLQEQTQLHRFAMRMGRERLCDYNVARRLHSLVRLAGFDEIEASAHQPVFTHGPYKHLEVLSFGEALDHWTEGDEAALAEGRRLCEAMREAADDPLVAYGLGMMMQVRARA